MLSVLAIVIADCPLSSQALSKSGKCHGCPGSAVRIDHSRQEFCYHRCDDRLIGNARRFETSERFSKGIAGHPEMRWLARRIDFIRRGLHAVAQRLERIARHAAPAVQAGNGSGSRFHASGVKCAGSPTRQASRRRRMVPSFMGSMPMKAISCLRSPQTGSR